MRGDSFKSEKQIPNGKLPRFGMTRFFTLQWGQTLSEVGRDDWDTAADSWYMLALAAIAGLHFAPRSFAQAPVGRIAHE